jgi:two-component system response regulator
MSGDEAFDVQASPTRSREDPRGQALARVVLIEDNPGDVELIRLSLAEVGLQPRLHVAIDAHRARELMASLDAPPALILLDLNLPIITGDTFLRELRAAGPWRETPVIVLTSSHLERDFERCFTWGATAFKTKPASFDGYIAFANSLRRYLE